LRIKVTRAAPVLLMLGLAACSTTPNGTAQPAETATVTASVPPSDAPTVTVTATPTTAPASPVASESEKVDGSGGSGATFEHFKVTVIDVDYKDASEALVNAEVCVRSLPADPQGDRTRISWDPWSVTAGTRAAQAGYTGDAPRRLFASDATYAVRECASGWIPFPISGDLDVIRYANGVGDKAVWDADHLGETPVTSHDPGRAESDNSRSRIREGTFIVGDDIQPGRYQATAAGPGGLCYWARLTDDTGDFDSIIANNSTTGRASVTIKSTDGAFESSGCTRWVRR